MALIIWTVGIWIPRKSGIHMLKNVQFPKSADSECILFLSTKSDRIWNPFEFVTKLGCFLCHSSQEAKNDHILASNHSSFELKNVTFFNVSGCRISINKTQLVLYILSDFLLKKLRFTWCYLLSRNCNVAQQITYNEKWN